MSEPEVQPEVQPEPQSEPEPPKLRRKRNGNMPEVAPVVANEPGLLRFIEALKTGMVEGSLQEDHWSWVYAGAGGDYSVLPERSEEKPAAARICLEGSTIVAWEPL